jgi:hypothetical protein
MSKAFARNQASDRDPNWFLADSIPEVKIGRLMRKIEHPYRVHRVPEKTPPKDGELLVRMSFNNQAN